MIYTNRLDAGKKLSNLLKPLYLKNPITIALPRGGIPIGIEVAKALDSQLFILPVRKIGHPDNPEYAIGAITKDSQIITQDFANINKIISKERKNLEKYSKKFNRLPSKNLKKKDVIVVDDGVATGTTINVSIQSIRKKNPNSITLAVPACTFRAESVLKNKVENWICPYVADFNSVGSVYENFEQLEDTEINHLLSQFVDDSQKVF